MPGEDRLVNNINLILKGLSSLILVLLANQSFLIMQSYFLQLQWKWLTLISLLGIIIGVIEARVLVGLKKWPKSLKVIVISGLLLLVYGVDSDYTSSSFKISSFIIILIYYLAYRLAYWSQKLDFDFESLKVNNHQQEQIYKRQGPIFKRYANSFKQLEQLVIIIDGLLVISWLFKQQINYNLILSGAFILVLQFLLLGFAFYQKKRILWRLNNYRTQPQLFNKMIGWLLILIISISAIIVILPSHNNFIPWQWLKDKLLTIDSKIKTPTPPLTKKKETSDAGSLKKGIEQALQQQDSFSWHLVLYLMMYIIFLMILVSIIIGFILTLLKEEYKNLKGLPGLLVKLYLTFINLVKGWGRLLKSGVKKLQMTVQTSRKHYKQEELEEILHNEEFKRDWSPDTPREEIIAYYIQAENIFKEKGCRRRKNQTISQFLQFVKEDISIRGQKIVAINDLIEQALYSNHAITKPQANKMKELIDNLANN